MSRLLITGSRAHQWTPYDFHALLIAVREILEKTLIIRICALMGDMTGAELGERVCSEDRKTRRYMHETTEKLMILAIL